MNDGRRELSQGYPTVLADCLADGGEAGLMRAYELGRRALASGASVVDVAVAHHQALAATLLDGGRPDLPHALEAAQATLAEVLSPFELARRQFGEANAALRRLNERLEEEARRIAHALHDEAGQLLVSAHLAIAGVAAELSPRERSGLDEVRRWLDAMEANLRRLSHELRPAILDDLGLLPGLEYLVEGVSARSGLKATIEGETGGRLGHVTDRGFRERGTEEGVCSAPEKPVRRPVSHGAGSAHQRGAPRQRQAGEHPAAARAGDDVLHRP